MRVNCLRLAYCPKCTMTRQLPSLPCRGRTFYCTFSLVSGGRKLETALFEGIREKEMA
jgi:hypothetical protein